MIPAVTRHRPVRNRWVGFAVSFLAVEQDRPQRMSVPYHQARTGQAAVRLGSKRLAGRGEVEDLLVCMTVWGRGRATCRVGREGDDRDARQVAESFEHRRDAAVEGDGVGVPKRGPRLD